MEMLSIEQSKFKGILEKFKFELNPETNVLYITIPEDLKISFNNTLDLSIGGEFNLDTLDSINIVSREHDINIDSFRARIFLNSLRSKQISELRECIELRKQREDEVKKRQSLAKHYTPNSNDDVMKLYIDLKKQYQSLLKRVEFLENKEKQTITISDQ